MSPTARALTLVLAGFAVAIGGFLVLRPGDEEEPASTAPAVTTTAATTTAAGTTPTATTAVPKPDATRIVLEDGRPVGGSQAIAVSKGDIVRLTVSSDAPDEIHVHGFDLEQEAAPGSPARFRFTADIEGKFEVEAHTTETQIAEITVNP